MEERNPKKTFCLPNCRDPKAFDARKTKPCNVYIFDLKNIPDFGKEYMKDSLRLSRGIKEKLKMRCKFVYSQRRSEENETSFAKRLERHLSIIAKNLKEFYQKNSLLRREILRRIVEEKILKKRLSSYIKKLREDERWLISLNDRLSHQIRCRRGETTLESSSCQVPVLRPSDDLVDPSCSVVVEPSRSPLASEPSHTIENLEVAAYEVATEFFPNEGRKNSRD